MANPLAFDSHDAAVDYVFQRLGDTIVLAAPLGLGKPHRLLNALYRRVAADPKRSLRVSTALSLTPPPLGSGLQRRFLLPFVERHFGADFEALDWTLAQRDNGLPKNIRVEEFYLQSGALLHSSQAQQSYTSINYTHVARAMASRGVNLIVQRVARDSVSGEFSLSCNPDLTLDLLDEMARRGLPRPLLLAEVHPDLPFMGGDAVVDAELFDAVVRLPGKSEPLFALPRQPVSDAEFAIGLYASTLVRDGGTLQIGIGALSDALSHALRLRHCRNSEYRGLIEVVAPRIHESALHCGWGGLSEFGEGLFGASEMITDGFMHLVECGVIKRRVLADVALMQRLFDGSATESDRARLQRDGQYLHAAFFLGSPDFYRWLRELPRASRSAIGMTRVSNINQLYGGRESIDRLQRRDARFFNTCMMTTLLGAAVSDGLEDGRVVSGVGGQYNFVAMAHALEEGRSVLMFRASREAHGRASSSVLWNYGHITIPRHLRDIVISEYGIADLRDQSDEDCIKAMLAISDARFIDALANTAKQAGKLAADFQIPEAWREHTPDRLLSRLRPYRQMGLLPDYPLGSDFSEVEQRLLRALAWLRVHTGSPLARLTLIAKALSSRGATDHEALSRMTLAAPSGVRESIAAKLLALALRRTA
ncbi:MAG: acetyl-CoA hydrolase/transferase C-terminal domain-containing protein [Pseudomarimonas sp.]